MTDTNIPRILDIADHEVAAERAKRADAVGQFVRKVLEADDPDAVFEDLARSYIQNQGQDSRRKCVTILTTAFGADRAEMKKILRGKSIVGEMD